MQEGLLKARRRQKCLPRGCKDIFRRSVSVFTASGDASDSICHKGITNNGKIGPPLSSLSYHNTRLLRLLTSDMLMESPNLRNRPEMDTYFVKCSKSYVSKSAVVPELTTDGEMDWHAERYNNRRNTTADSWTNHAHDEGGAF